MADFGFSGGHGRQSALFIASFTTGVANTKGPWVDVVTSTPFQASALAIQLAPGTTTARYLIDIGVGATPQTVIPNLGLYFRSPSLGNMYTDQLRFPISIPVGSKISVRAQSSNASDTGSLVCTLIGDPLIGNPLIGKYADLGTDLANSTGVALTVPASGTSAYAQITASTPNRLRSFLASFAAYGMSADTDWTTEFAVGPAGSEVVFARCKNLFRPSDGVGMGPLYVGYATDIPGGVRLAVRAIFGGGGGGTISIPTIGGC